MSKTNFIEILDNRINVFTKGSLHSIIEETIDNQKKELILNVNVQAINISKKDKKYKEFMNSARAVFCDGFGIQLAAKILKLQVPEKITYVDWIWDLATLCSEKDYSLFLLGSDEVTIEKVVKLLRAKIPALRIAGYHHGYFNKQGVENNKIIELINTSAPDILMVGFGMPLQEKWLEDNWANITSHVFLTSGGCFDVIGGKYPKCPRVLQDWGLQWLFRLILEPRRLFKRYVIGNPQFLLNVLRRRFNILL